MDYIDTIPSVVKLLKTLLGVRVYGNRFPANAELPSLMVRSAGGTDYTRLQLIARANSDSESMGLAINAMNRLENNAAYLSGIRVVWAERESVPVPDYDEDTGKPEAWVYLRLEHLEA
ncbi:hypothetical protein OCO53_25330 [Peribacillus frigoritolerans]|uniref:hypothetical protein n=1 Tax=Peribacillus frigoritolerans TaxID=450367 RepID=UPI0021CF587B|nr:hypothetical protein [Peribacillus frigoritolerans]MCU6603766.1 hypothetical protein [Peribacillus frigoritolerans]